MPDHYVVAADNERGFTLAPFPKSFPHMKATWLRPGPETMYWVPRHVAKIWNVKSIYITENGTSGATSLPRTAPSMTSIASCTCATI